MCGGQSSLKVLTRYLKGDIVLFGDGRCNRLENEWAVIIG
ncbi:hypothetical protein THOM_1068 [Trachipleistophora hominis]|uniref:Uncharacterized protein n=1 Tax=Trachipleistophora hominis TaxID=72359 RepID=L7JX05_TRAHO|nr:hypothetical protein THOM_1068 [Trachipleistophora hominis]